ncbi:hypothetical protein OG738_13615 [Amycolatopsis sp. NBC_01488]|uniref:hypothetical protein n=1 Tax=Amycolatopsis sp. NBC_01488 TaxID=2903563 RepID=UPI002E29AD21|nr:hypothetical protein [Amycolatopsis sp. NBC_01488]
MDGYAVKVDELGKLIDDLDTAAGKMADADKKLGGGGAFGSLGTADLGKAGGEFEEAWGYGIGRLGEAASGITERLKQAKQKYEQIEAEFGAELNKFGSAVLGGGDDPTLPQGQRGNYPRVGGPSGGSPGPLGNVLGDDGMVGGGVTGGVPGIGDLAERKDPGADLGGGMVGGGVMGGVPGINDLAARKDPGGGMVGGGVMGGVPGSNDQAERGDPDPGGGMVGGGATGGITDILDGRDR